MTAVLLFPGCTYANTLPHFVRAYHQLLTIAGFDVTVFEPQLCCGFPYRAFGQKQRFATHASRLVEAIHELALQTIVNLCPTCNRHFEKHLRRDCGLRPDIVVQHITTFVHAHRQRWALSGSGHSRPPVGYQDPCWLVRRSRDAHSPRELSRACGYELRDGSLPPQFSDCCGYAGIVPLHHPEVSAMVAQRRLDHFRALAVEQIITSCPRCYSGMKQACERSAGDLRVRDLSELQTEACQLE